MRLRFWEQKINFKHIYECIGLRKIPFKGKKLNLMKVDKGSRLLGVLCTATQIIAKKTGENSSSLHGLYLPPFLEKQKSQQIL